MTDDHHYLHEHRPEPRQHETRSDPDGVLWLERCRCGAMRRVYRHEDGTIDIGRWQLPVSTKGTK